MRNGGSLKLPKSPMLVNSKQTVAAGMVHTRSTVAMSVGALHVSATSDQAFRELADTAEAAASFVEPTTETAPCV